ncbi:Non-histone chromosomal protein HMG-14, partial [Lemmus lemmus]
SHASPLQPRWIRSRKKAAGKDKSSDRKSASKSAKKKKKKKKNKKTKTAADLPAENGETENLSSASEVEEKEAKSD